MRNCATYDETGSEISNCSEINFIYGPNGSGKSTISNYFQDLGALKYSSCSVMWEFDQPMEVLVYNRHFKESNFSGEIDGIFTLGKDIIEDLSTINKLKELKKQRTDELHRKKTFLKHTEEECDRHTHDFQDTIWNVILKENDTYFQEAFTGCRASKKVFFNQVLEKYQIQHTSQYTRDELLKKTITLFDKKPEKYEVIELKLDDLIAEIVEIEKHEIWEKHIVGNQDVPIAKLIDLLHNIDWVKKGVEYVDDSKVCPFCQQKTISEDLKAQFENFFSGEYETYMQLIKYLKESYVASKTKLIEKLSTIFSNDNYFTISNIDKNKLTTLIELLEININNNLSKINTKESEASRSIILNITTIDEIVEIINEGNKVIKQHNNMVDNYNTEKKKLINEIWSFLLDEHESLISGYLSEHKKFEKAIVGIKKSIYSFEKEITDIENRIVEVNKNMSSVQPTVDEINRLLKAYGFNNFRIVPSPTQENSYQIQRLDGSLANNTLSEGEETFISFLYFLQLTKGATDVSKVSTEKVLIIDDPICSLDSTILYIVSSLVKSLISDIKESNSNIKQVFIFTHNVFFHKEASFINGVADTSNAVSYWIIHKDETTSKIIAYGHNNPIHTSYELLWHELKDSNLSSFITIQNTMRRIIENYFGMLGNRKYDYLKKQFSTIEEQRICESLFYWVNDGSHSIPDDLYIDSYSDSIDKYKKVFREVFYRSGNSAHYNMMMGISQNGNQSQEDKEFALATI